MPPDALCLAVIALVQQRDDILINSWLCLEVKRYPATNLPEDDPRKLEHNIALEMRRHPHDAHSRLAVILQPFPVELLDFEWEKKKMLGEAFAFRGTLTLATLKPTWCDLSPPRGAGHGQKLAQGWRYILQGTLESHDEEQQAYQDYREEISHD